MIESIKCQECGTAALAEQGQLADGWSKHRNEGCEFYLCPGCLLDVAMRLHQERFPSTACVISDRVFPPGESFTVANWDDLRIGPLDVRASTSLVGADISEIGGITP